MAEIEKQKYNNKDKEKEKVVGAAVQMEQEGLPRTIVRRLVKDKLSQLSTDTDISLLCDSLVSFSESARIFVHYLSSTANDICKESKRQTINAEDVFKALEEIEFPELIEPLKASLEGITMSTSSDNFEEYITNVTEIISQTHETIITKIQECTHLINQLREAIQDQHTLKTLQPPKSPMPISEKPNNPTTSSTLVMSKLATMPSSIPSSSQLS